MKDFVDISVYQKNINYSQMASQIDGAILRLGYTGYGSNKPAKDAMFDTHYRGFKNAGVPVGVYYFTIAYTEAMADAEASFILNQLKDYPIELPVWIDCEEQNNSAGWTNLDKAKRSSLIYRVAKTVENAGYYVGIYASTNWLNNKLDMNVLKDFDVWVAQYNTVCTYGGKYGMWQYSSTAKIDGYSGKIDVSHVYKDYVKIIKNMHEPKEEVSDEFTPAKWRSETIGNGYDIDKSYGNQCWDYMAKFLVDNGLSTSMIHCALTKYVQDIWTLRKTSGILNYFDEITEASQLQNGDWVIFPKSYINTPLSHICMFYNGKALGQNQNGKAYVTEVDYLDFKYMSGAFRWKPWGGSESVFNNVFKSTIVYDGVEVFITKISKKLNVRGSVDGNHYGVPYDKTISAGFSDSDLTKAGFEEVTMQNGSLFYTYDDACFAEGIEISKGVNNQDFGMSAVQTYADCMAVGFPYEGGMVFGKTSDIIAKASSMYGAVTGGWGIIYNGAKDSYTNYKMHGQADSLSGHSIIAEDDDYYYSIACKGNTGSTGLNREQVYNMLIMISPNMKNAINMDGGGSVFQRTFGQYAINTSRLVKNGVGLFAKVSGTAMKDDDVSAPDSPAVQPNTDVDVYAEYMLLKADYSKLKSDYDSLVSEYRSLTERLTALLGGLK